MTRMVTIQARQKWDYCFENRKTENAMLAALNELGQQGWELVDISHHKDLKGEMCWTAFLKRPNVGQSPAADQQTEVAEKSAPPAGQTGQEPPQPPGFDLSGNEFQLKTE